MAKTTKQKADIEALEQQIDFESVSNKLLELSQTGGLRRKKTVTDLLDRVKPALEQARRRKVSFVALTKFLNDSGIPVSEPTLRQYLRRTKNKTMRSVTKTDKSTTEPQAELIGSKPFHPDTPKVEVEPEKKQAPRLARKLQ